MTKKRTKKEQSEHDKTVEKKAKELRRKGYDVEADLPGWKRPEPIGKKKRIPDIVAKDKKTGKVKKIIEVETGSTIDKDRDQQSTFRRSAAKRGAKFELIKAKKGTAKRSRTNSKKNVTKSKKKGLKK